MGNSNSFTTSGKFPQFKYNEAPGHTMATKNCGYKIQIYRDSAKATAAELQKDDDIISSLLGTNNTPARSATFSMPRSASGGGIDFEALCATAAATLSPANTRSIQNVFKPKIKAGIRKAMAARIFKQTADESTAEVAAELLEEGTTNATKNEAE